MSSRQMRTQGRSTARMRRHTTTLSPSRKQLSIWTCHAAKQVVMGCEKRLLRAAVIPGRRFDSAPSEFRKRFHKRRGCRNDEFLRLEERAADSIGCSKPDIAQRVGTPFPELGRFSACPGKVLRLRESGRCAHQIRLPRREAIEERPVPARSLRTEARSSLRQKRRPKPRPMRPCETTLRCSVPTAGVRP
jgi:hypothetical protein